MNEVSAINTGRGNYISMDLCSRLASAVTMAFVAWGRCSAGFSGSSIRAALVTCEGLASAQGLSLLASLSQLQFVQGQTELPEGWVAGNEFRISTYSLGEQRFPKMAVLPQGFVVTWDSEYWNPDHVEIVGQLFDPLGVKLGPEFSVTVATDVGNAGSSTASLNAGFITLWHQENLTSGLSLDSYAQIFDGNANEFGPAFRVNEERVGNQWFPKAAEIANGFVVAWIGVDGDSSRGIYGQLFDNQSNRIGAEFPVYAGAGTQNIRSVVGLPEGFVVMWASFDQVEPGTDTLYAQRFAADGARIGEELAIHDLSIHVRGGATLARVPRGIATVWASAQPNTSDTYAIQGQLYDYELNRLASHFDVTRVNTGELPLGGNIIGIPDGMVAAWYSNTSDTDIDVFARIFDPDANYVGTPFRVNEFTVGLQQRPSIVALPNGFAIAWESSQQDPDGSQGIYGRVFTYRGASTMNANTLPTTGSRETSMAAMPGTSVPRTEAIDVLQEPNTSDDPSIVASAVTATAFLIGGSVGGAGLVTWLLRRRNLLAATSISGGDSTGAVDATTEPERHYQTPLPEYDRVNWPAPRPDDYDRLGDIPPLPRSAQTGDGQ